MAQTKLKCVLASMVLTCSSLGFADGEVAPEVEQQISSALEKADSGYTNVQVVGEETINNKSCYRITFNDQGNDVELVLNKETFRPCEENLMHRSVPYIPVYNPGLWAAVYSTIINAPRSPSSNRPSRARPCNRRCRR